MEFLREYVETFADLFNGNPNKYGKHVPDSKQREDGKREGKASFLVKKPLTDDIYLKHLHGEISIGVSPMQPDNKVWFGAIDIDVYPLDPKKYIAIIQRSRLPVCLFRSKSGGLHGYIFFSRSEPADKVIKTLQEIRQLFGLKPKTEVFPKQSRLVGDSIGNWINLPYYKVKEPTRYMYDMEGNAMSLERALLACKNSRITLRDLNGILANCHIADGPPCLQAIFLAGGAEKGERNVFLFNMACFLKSKYKDDFSDKLHALNKKCDEPIDYKRLDTTVIASHNRKEYTYACNDPVLKQLCDRDLCKSRKHGIESEDLSDVTFEGLKQVKCDNPYYIWTVNGVELTFYSERDLINQNRFRELCLRELLILPRRMADRAWANQLKRALENVEVEIANEGGDLTTESLWISKVGEFFSRHLAIRPIQMLDGLPWYSSRVKKLCCSPDRLYEYLLEIPAFRDFEQNKHRQLLKKLNATTTRVTIAKGKQIRVIGISLRDFERKGIYIDVDKDVKKEELEVINFKEFQERRF